MSQHTPGPWTVSEKHESCIHGGRVVQLKKGPIKPQVATLCGHETMEPGEMLANARLIAAAPDMLAAGNAMTATLATLPSDLTHEEYLRATDEVFENLVAACRKATRGV